MSEETVTELNFKMQDCPESNNIKQVGYDAENEALFVEFSYGGKYIYSDVPQKMFDLMMDADSTGSFFSKQIKGVYEFTKVEK